MSFVIEESFSATLGYIVFVEIALKLLGFYGIEPRLKFSSWL